MEPYTREMPLRRESSYRSLRRLREWWFGIPAAPVQLIKYENSKKKKWPLWLLCYDTNLLKQKPVYLFSLFDIMLKASKLHEK